MPPKGHALLSASGAHRWLACTPSALLEDRFPDKAGTAAEEGTLAHAIVEERLSRIIAGKRVGKTSTKLRNNPLYRSVMEDHVDTYIAYVMDLYAEAKERTADALLVSEQQVDFSRWVPEGFGTSDTMIIADGVMDIIDFKYGKGVPVEAAGNPQLRLYALGALERYDILYDIHTVRMHIVQPRLDSESCEQMSAEALYQWAEEHVQPRAKQAIGGKGTFAPGEHCRFCRAAATCKARAAAMLDVIGDEPAPALLTNDEIAILLPRLDEITRWAKQVKDYALAEALAGGEFPGYKLVEGRSNRVIIDDADAIDILTGEGFLHAQITKMRGLSELEELVGKKRLGELVGHLIAKPTGKPVLVVETDRREAINTAASAAADFNDNFEED